MIKFKINKCIPFVFSISVIILQSCEKDSILLPVNPIQKEGWDLTFSEEFNGDSLNRTIWKTSFEWGQTEGDGDPAQALFVDSAISIKGGLLRIRMKREEATGVIYDKNYSPVLRTFPFTTGLVNSRHAFEQSQGYFEGRIKAPKGNGYWPAFWLMTGDSWPPEIDIFEMQGRNTRLLHFANHFGTSIQDHQQVAHTTYGPDFSEDFHTFAVEWDNEQIKWFLDNTLMFISKKGIPRNKMYLIISVGVGGGWSGSADNSTPDVAYLEADYVRVYKKKN